MIRFVIAVTMLIAHFAAAQASDLSHSCAMVDGVASDDVLWIRTCPDVDCDRIGHLKHDETMIDIGDCQGNWCQVMDKNYDPRGWSSSKYLKPDDECEAWEVWADM